MTDNENVKELIIRKAPFICCPMCDKEKCVGRNNCIDIKNYIKDSLEELENGNR